MAGMGNVRGSTGDRRHDRNLSHGDRRAKDLHSGGNGNGIHHWEAQSGNTSGAAGANGGVVGGLNGADDGMACKFQSLDEVVGQLMSVAQDQNGCRFLQRKFDEGGPVVSSHPA